MKKTVILGLLVILLVFCFSGCDNGNNDPKVYTVTIWNIIKWIDFGKPNEWC
jgi:hypothetical protein